VGQTRRHGRPWHIAIQCRTAPAALAGSDLTPIDAFYSRNHGEDATLQCAGNRRAGLIEIRPIEGEDPWGSTPVR
jgi:sulfite oxidase